MCVRLLYIRVQVFVTVPFFVYFFASFSNIIENQKIPYRQSKKYTNELESMSFFISLKVYRKTKITLL